MHDAVDILIRRLEACFPLTMADREAFRALDIRHSHVAPARVDLVHEGEAPGDLRLILTGWACRYRVMADGRRQITSFLLPGDICDLNADMLDEMDHSIGALTDVRFAEIPHGEVARLMEASERIRRAFWRLTLTTVAIQREWTVNLGQRSAFERLGHLFCEIFWRLRFVDLTRGTSCELPVTQTDLADALGITAVHINRTLQELRGRFLISLKSRILTIPDLARLEADVLFTPNYLHCHRHPSLADKFIAGQSSA